MNTDLDAASDVARTTLGALQTNLFEEGTPAVKATMGAPVTFFSAPSEGRECVEIARRVLALATDGIAFDRMAVLLRAPEAYRAHLEEAFARASIPAYFTRGARRPDPAGRAFIALLACAADNLSARRFAEYLSLAQVPDAGQGGMPPPVAEPGDRWIAPDSEIVDAMEPDVDARDEALTEAGYNDREAEAPVRDGQLRAPWRWEALLVDAAVIGGRDRWQRRIDGLAHALRLRMAEVTDEDEAEAAVLERQIDDLAAFRSYTLPLIAALSELPSNAIWAEWLDQLTALASRALKRPDRVLGVLAELAPLAPVGPVTLPEVVRVLAPLLLEIATRPGAQRYGQVYVGPVDAVRGLSFDTVFVPGLAERLFPRKIIEEPILLDRVRATISSQLTTNHDRLAAERLALRLAVGAAENRICFSYPRLDLEAPQPRPRVPSFYALEVMRASEGHLPDFAALAKRAETAATSRLGWPAPPDPVQAIDDAEYDLAVLERLTAAPVVAPGTARYLVKANPQLYRALGARYHRWGSSWTSADGLLTRDPAAHALMAYHGFGRRSYSPTALQHYARCPYRFFLSAAQRLAPRIDPEPIDELDPLQRGALIHAVQFELLAQLRRDALLPVRPGHLVRAWELLDRITADVAARYYDELAPAIDRVWLDGIAGISADLREWLRRASEDDSGFVPQHFELAFGLGLHDSEQADPRSVPGAVEIIGGLQLRGSIDLVESHPSGHLRVADHKTGKLDGKAGQVIAGGKTLQPLLYGLVAEKLFSGAAVLESGRLYFCTASGGYTVIDVPLNQEARKAAAQVAETIGDALARPFLPAAPDKQVCARCNFHSICGPHEERRVRRKPKTPLGPLHALREVP